MSAGKDGLTCLPQQRTSDSINDGLCGVRFPTNSNICVHDEDFIVCFYKKNVHMYVYPLFNFDNTNSALLWLDGVVSMWKTIYLFI